MTDEAFLTEADFESGVFPPREFNLVADELNLGDEIATDVPLRAQYDRHSVLLLHDDRPNGLFKLLADNADAVISGTHFPKRVGLIPISMTVDGSVLLPKTQPVLWQANAGAQSVSGILVNGPSLEFCNSSLTFARDGYEISLEEFASVKELRRQARLHKDDCIATAVVSMRADDGRVIDPDTALAKLSHLTRFFTFVRGGGCSIGNIRGLDDRGDLAFVHLGFSKFDGFLIERGWCDMEVIRDAPRIYDLYSATVSDAENTRVLLRAIDYYRASNVARPSSPEMALVASYAGLETLVPHILAGQAGWSNAKLGPKTPFHEKLGAAVSFIGVSADPLEHAPHLAARAKIDTKGDPFKVLSLFRNRITHHKKKFSYTGVEVMEAWQLSQWLCELLIFHSIGYRGAMNDRRRYSGHRGPTVPTPLA